MTPIRGLALKISNAVVRYASPGCKEWAEGLAREVAFVEGDWAALAWALGSLRVLFDYRDAPIASLAELPMAAKKFAKAKHSGNGTWILSLYFGLTWAAKSFHATSWPEHVGWSMAAFGSILLGIVALIQWCREIKMPPSNDRTALIQFYKASLERALDFHRSPDFWIGIPAIIILCVGLMLVGRGWVWFRANPVSGVYLGLLSAGILLLFLQLRRNNRRRLERLEALLAEQS